MNAFTRIAFAIAAAAVFGACVSAQTRPSEAEIRRLLPGTWRAQESGDGLSVSMTKRYFPDGTARGELNAQHRLGATIVHEAPNPFRSRWRVSGDTMECYDVRDRLGFFTGKEIMKDRVLKISATELVFRPLEGDRRIRRDIRVSE